MPGTQIRLQSAGGRFVQSAGGRFEVQTVPILPSVTVANFVHMGGFKTISTPGDYADVFGNFAPCHPALPVPFQTGDTYLDDDGVDYTGQVPFAGDIWRPLGGGATVVTTASVECEGFISPNFVTFYLNLSDGSIFVWKRSTGLAVDQGHLFASQGAGLQPFTSYEVVR